jgi:chemotaxis protein MotB
MGKKHKHPEHENLERWLVSYADFITLLFATFVVLYALGQLDLAKLKEVRHSLQQAFNPTAAVPAAGIMGQSNGVMPGSPESSILSDSGNSILDKLATSPKDIDVPKNPTAEQLNQHLNQQVGKINQDIQKLNAQHQQPPKQGKTGAKDGKESEKTPPPETIPNVQISAQERGIVISISNTLFFEPGSASVKPAAAKVLDKLAKGINNSGRMIHIEGHTDSTPIATALFPSNWELSSARASSVVRYLNSQHKIPSHRLAAIGYGQSRPKASNFSPEGRQSNRRVDIVLLANQVAEATGEIPKSEPKSKEKSSHTPSSTPSHNGKVSPRIRVSTPKTNSQNTLDAKPLPHSNEPSSASHSSQRVIRVSLESKPSSKAGESIAPKLAPNQNNPQKSVRQNSHNTESSPAHH